MKVVILAGGKGTRLGLTDKPKPMVPVAGRPLLERLIEVGKKSDFRDFVLLTGHLSEVIENHFGDGSRMGVRIEYSREPTPLGTAGAVRKARHLLDAPFIVMYGDILLDVDLYRFAEFHREKGGLGTLFVHPNDHPFDSDLVDVDDQGRIRRFLPKPHDAHGQQPNLVSAAIYVLDPQMIDYVPEEGQSDWGQDVFPAVLGAGESLYSYRSLEYAKDIGTPDRLERAESDLLSGRLERLSTRTKKPAVFFDRDGVLNEEIGGVHTVERLHLLEGAGEAVREVNRAGIPAICVTNQPDVAKGLMTSADLTNVMAALDTKLAEHRAYLDDSFYCIHHPERGWPGEVAALKVECACRKPKPGLLLAAADRHSLDLTRSWLIGDRYADVVAAHSAGCRAVLVRTGHAGSDQHLYEDEPDYTTDNIGDAVAYVLRKIS